MPKIKLYQDLENRFKEGFDLIQVILGPRQVGKTTTVLKILKNQSMSYLYFSAEEKLIIGPDWLDQVWQKAEETALEKKDQCLLVIDEVQKIEN